ncbi:hypothetical protein SAMN05216249_10218 [Acetitomaculum ruminis DSM 5522]|uniref:DhaL domain-containing protein n=1 Tax=Acetitomaculum ruminis DSM 5522 TaxID=1120918 RepID=A0A1I0VHL8_9FIRM|nr:DAK2 domain-containing protein [Acetitomaculum ruminis]SFA75874.1 hypothetical protein SAMN05216249_10218 [Acetitomaculum ruminis DSM 5522]
MEKNTIDAKTLSKMFLAAANRLDSSKEWINELNVFPVPDGDTGTNMTMTIMSAAREVSNVTDCTMKNVCKAMASGSLRGARGNSGVILSQLIRGFTKIVAEYDVIDVMVISNAFQKAVETAYKAVMKPKEGTILTVAKGMSEKASEMVVKIDDVEEFFKEVIDYGQIVLNKTPDLLPVLKEAGVVDSGGQGLLEVIKGAYDGYLGKESVLSFDKDNTPKPVAKTASSKPIETEDIKFGYCTEFIIKLEKEFTEEMEEEFKNYLLSIGDSLVLVSDDEIVKVHVHTNHPGLAFEKALTHGSLTRMKVDNMREEHQEKVIKDSERLAKEQALNTQKAAPKELKEYGFISVSAGDGIEEIFKSLGADYVIKGGQTMNPSTEDMLNAIDNVYAKNIFILPNNGNIILAANQAKDLVTDKNIIVIPTKTVPQGITALINFISDRSVEENEECMLDEIKNVKTGQVTYAVRDTSIDGFEINQGDYMGVGDSSIVAVGKELNETVKLTVSKLVDDESSLVSLYYGDEISKEDAEKLAEELEEEFDECDVELHSGGQPVYYYIVSVE